VGQIEDAVAAYARARADIERAEAKARDMVASARERAAQAQQDVWAAIVAEATAGVTQVELIRRSGLARETVRRILRRGGVEAAE
jgi:hypothetical protein